MIDAIKKACISISSSIAILATCRCSSSRSIVICCLLLATTKDFFPLQSSLILHSSTKVVTVSAFVTIPKNSQMRRMLLHRLHSSSSSSSSSKRPFQSSSSRKEEAKRLGKSQKELHWDHYDFSNNPKQDNRFNNGSKVIAATGELSRMDAQQEAQRDKALAQKINLSHEAFLKLDPETVSQATLLLEQYINPDRLERVGSVLRQRTKRSKFLFENPSNPSNVWACLRTIDSFGIQNVDVAMNSGMYSGKQALNQKRGMRTAMGSAQWLTLSVHGSCQEAVHHIRNVQGYKIYASDLNPKSKDVRDIDWDAGPICVVMGNEDRGISEEMRELADETFVLPMCGFAESFNLSVATSITLAHMSSKSGNGKGPLRPGDLDEHEYNCLYLKGLMNSLPQKKMGRALLQKHGIVLPDAIKDL